LLGSNGVPSNPNFTNTRIYAIANGQPSLVPVLQIHSPEGPPSAGSSLNGEQKFRIDGYKAGGNTTINAVFVWAAHGQPKSQQVCITLCVSWKMGVIHLTGLCSFKAQCLTQDRSQLFFARSDDDGSVHLDTLSPIKRLTVHPWYATPLHVTISGFDVDFVSVSRPFWSNIHSTACDSS